MKSFSRKVTKKEIFILVILLLVSVPSAISFVHNGFPKTDDGNWIIIRFSAFYSAFKDGEIPVRWLSRLNNGYGYPVANFLYPGFMYLGIPLAVITSSFVTSVKILFTISLVASGVGMFLFLRRKYDMWSAFVGALVYLYSPYHLYDATVRGSLGEVLTLAIAPFVFWLIERGSILLASMAVALLILSHNTLALLFLPVIVLYSLLVPGVNKKNAVISILGGVGMATFFWLPALLDLRYTVFSQTTISDWSQYFASLQIIGVVQLAVIVGVIVVFILHAKKRNKVITSSTILFLFFGIVSLFLSSSLSHFVWIILPVKFIQFPFRFLSLGIFAAASLVPMIVSHTPWKKTVGIVIVLLSFVTTYPYLMSHAYDEFPETYYSTNMDTTTVKNEYMPRGAKQIPTTLPAAKVVTEHGTMDNLITTNKKFAFSITTPQESKVTISQLYFPGWKAYLDKKEIPINSTNSQGIMQIRVSTGRHTVSVLFKEFSYRLVSDIISLLSFLSLVVITIYLRRKN